MLKKTLQVGNQNQSNKAFDEYRTAIVEEFMSQKLFSQKKITQGAFWTALDKDLAQQYIRDERWIFGLKYHDDLKLIDHGLEEVKPNGIGFGKTK